MTDADGASRRETLATLQAERDHLALELLRYREDLQFILEATPALIFYKDTQNNILRVNRAVATSLGVSPEDMSNTSTERWYPVDANAYYADDLAVMRSKQ